MRLTIAGTSFAGLVLTATLAAADPPPGVPPAGPPPAAPVAAPEPAVAYVGPDEVATRLKSLVGDRATLSTYGTSAGGRPLLLLKIGKADLPQVLVHGGVGTRDSAGTAAALDFAERILKPVEAGKPDPLAKVGFLVIPAPNPDALAAFLANTIPAARGGGNWDRDKDGRLGEDGPDDVDGDHEILTMRRKDAAGTFAVDDAPPSTDEKTKGKKMGDPRLMKDAGVDARREASYLVTEEGSDQDGDGEVDEDPPGIDLTRNFAGTWDEPGPWPGDGPFPGFAPEVKALMDLSYETTNLVAWYGFASEGPRLERANERGKDADADDALYAKLVPAWKAACGLETRKASEGPGGGHNPGSDLDWASRHLGVVAVRVPVWQIAKEETNGRERADPDELDWLLWNDRVLKGAGFVAWHEAKHPQYGTVEIGGWKRFTRYEPPPDLLTAAVKKVSMTPAVHADFAPRIAVLATVKPLGAGLYEVKARVENSGGAPTDTASAERERRSMSVRASFAPAAGATTKGGPVVAALGILAAGGVSAETTWIVERASSGALGTVTARHRTAGVATKEVTTP